MTSPPRLIVPYCLGMLSICTCTFSAAAGTPRIDASPSTTLSGILEAIVVDDFAQDTSEMQYYLRGDDCTGRQIRFPAAPRLRPETRITVTGQTVGERFFVNGFEEMSPSVSMLAESAPEDLHVLGEQSTLVLLLNFLDDLSEPNTVAEVEEMIFDESNPLSVNSRLREHSFGKAWLAGDILDWQTLPINSGACAGYVRPISSSVQNTVDFIDDLVDFSLYTRIIVLKPSGDCTVGAVGSFGDITITTDEGQFWVSVAVATLSEFSNPPSTMSHELGHNFRMTHHGAIECGDAAVGNYADGCDVIPRGRPYDPMARSGQGHHNASAKQRLGWFDPQNIATLGTGTHVINIYPLELPSDQVQTVRIPAAYNLQFGSESAYYVIEYRQAIGLDAKHAELDDPQAGVLLNLEERDYVVGPALLDTSPHVTTAGLTQTEDIEEDAFLRLGQTFTDTKHDITVTFSGVASGAAVLTIDVPRLCDDGVCDPGEDSCSCPTDCGSPDPADCTLNGTPDECEPDCNNNGVADSCEIVAGTTDDCPGGTGNGIPDECDPQVDCNGNGIIDSCDIAGDPRGDLNANGIPDDCEPHGMVYVDLANCPGPGSGTAQSPFCNIQDAIDAQSLDAGQNGVVEIVVADGTYTGERNKDLDFAGRLITLRSVNGPDNCIIDMQGEGRGFYFDSGESAGARVEGLTIRNGLADGIPSPVSLDRFGAGIFCQESSPTIVDCTIRGNTAQKIGGGIFLTSRSNPAIRDCRITDNFAVGSSAPLFGAGIACIGSSPTISGCVISGNTTTGPNSDGRGGGMYLERHSNPTITACTISNNTVLGSGGGIYCVLNSNPTVRDCRITNNSSTSPVGAGGAVFAQTSRPTFDQCTITGNTALGFGAGIVITKGATAQVSEIGVVIRNSLIASNDGPICGGGIAIIESGTATIENGTIAGNTSALDGAGICLIGFEGQVVDLNVTNSILWGNVSQGVSTNELAQISSDTATVTVNHSDIQGLTGALGGIANINADPQFVGGTDLRLTECSPCLDAGDNSAVTSGFDLDGGARIANGVVDMGAYELLHPTGLSCQPGTFSATGQSTCDQTCPPCPAGTIQPAAGGTSCSPCSPGTIAATTGSTFCSPCPAGAAQPEAAGTACIVCDPGTFAAAPGTASCSPCPADTFQPNFGASECIGCGCDDSDTSTLDWCDPVIGSCRNLEIAIPAASTWSLICLALLLMSAATILMPRALDRVR